MINKIAGVKFKRSIITVLSLLFAIFSFAQDNYLDSLRAVLAETRNDSVKCEILGRLARNLRLKDTLQASNYANQALDLSIKTKNKKSLAEAYNTLGEISRAKGRYPEALNLFEKSLALNKEIKDSVGIGSELHNLGMIYSYWGNYTEALNNFFTSLQIFERADKKLYAAVCLNSIGGIYDYLQDYKKSLEYYQKALELHSALANKSGKSTTLNNIGEVYKKLGKYYEALKFYSFSLELKREINSIAGMAVPLNNIGEVLELQENYPEALNYYFKAAEIEKKLDYAYLLSVTYINIGRVYAKLNKFELSYSFANMGMGLAKSVNAKENLVPAYEALSQIAELEGNYQKSLEYYKEFYKLKNEIFDHKNRTLITELNLKYEIDKKEKEIELLTKKEALQDLKIKNDRLWIIVSSLIIILGSFVIFLITRNNKQRKRDNELLERRNMELFKEKEEKEILLKEIHHRVKNNLQIINSLLRLQSFQIDDVKVTRLFEEAQNRVNSMGLIHAKLYQSDNLSNVSIKDYLETLLENLIKTYSINKSIQLEVKTDINNFDINTLIPLGLLFNEFISNSLKYAWKEKEKGVISVSLENLSDHKCALIYKDNGVGLGAGFNIDKVTSLGMELIKALAEQLKGRVEILNEPGASFMIIFENKVL